MPISLHVEEEMDFYELALGSSFCTAQDSVIWVCLPKGDVHVSAGGGLAQR